MESPEYLHECDFDGIWESCVNRKGRDTDLGLTDEISIFESY